MTSAWKGATSAVVALSLTGCADLTVTRIDAKTGGTPQYGQLVYYLPQTRLIGTITVTLSDCTTNTQAVTDPKTQATTLKATDYSFIADESMTVVSTTEPDPDFHYAISLKEAQSWLKEINFKLDTNPDNTFQGFNGSMNDQAGPIGVAAISAAVKIAGAAILPGAHTLPPPGGGSDDLQLCNVKTVAALTAIKSANDAVKAINKKKVDTTYTQDKKDSELASAQNDLATAQKKADLTHTARIEWLPSGKLKSPYEMTRSYALQDLIASWLSANGLKLYGQATPGGNGPFAEAKKNLTVQLLLKNATLGDSSDDTHFGPDDKSTPAAPGGIVLRQPALATLRVCKGACGKPDANGYTNTSSQMGTDQAIALGQFGQLRIYPAHSALFENATLVLATNPDGTITSVSDHTTSTAAANLATLGTAADSASSALTARNTAITSANTAQQAVAGYADSANKQHADCITQRAAIEAAGEKALPCQ